MATATPLSSPTQRLRVWVSRRGSRTYHMNPHCKRLNTDAPIAITLRRTPNGNSNKRRSPYRPCRVCTDP